MKKQTRNKRELLTTDSDIAFPHLYASVNNIDEISNELPQAKTVSIKEIYAGAYQTTEFYKPISTVLIDL